MTASSSAKKVASVSLVEYTGTHTMVADMAKFPIREAMIVGFIMGMEYMDGSAGVYRWEFEKGKKSLSVAVNGPLIVDDLDLVIRAATDGVGLAYMSEEDAAPNLASGALVSMLEDWCQPFAGFFLYYPSRRQQPAALSALIDVLRM